MFLLSQSEETSTGGDPPSAGPSLGFLDLPDPMTAATVAARAVASSVVAVAARLRAGQGISKFAVRVNLDPENVSHILQLSSANCRRFPPEKTAVLCKQFSVTLLRTGERVFLIKNCLEELVKCSPAEICMTNESSFRSVSNECEQYDIFPGPLRIWQRRPAPLLLLP